MATRRDIRELALQALFELDARQGDHQIVQVWVDQSPLNADARAQSMKLAELAYANRAEPDALATELAPGWPTSRQPAVDRAIIRLAWQEMTSGFAPAKVAVNEAVELAKRYSTERSPAFLNGVLDKMMKRLPSQPATNETDVETTGDAWLDDALKEGRKA